MRSRNELVWLIWRDARSRVGDRRVTRRRRRVTHRLRIGLAEFYERFGRRPSTPPSATGNVDGGISVCRRAVPRKGSSISLSRSDELCPFGGDAGGHRRAGAVGMPLMDLRLKYFPFKLSVTSKLFKYSLGHRDVPCCLATAGRRAPRGVPGFSRKTARFRHARETPPGRACQCGCGLPPAPVARPPREPPRWP
jgi:hypothetical protein